MQIRNIRQIIVVLLFTCLCVGTYAQPYMLDQIIGIVGGKPIKQSDVEARYLDYRRQGIPVQGDMKCEIFEELLTEKLLINQAEVDSITVSESTIELELNRRLSVFIAQIGSQERMEEFFRKNIYEIKDDLRKSLRQQLLAQQMQAEIVKDVKVNPAEVRKFFNDIPKDSVPLIQGQAEIAQILIYPPYSEEAIDEVRQKLLDLRRRVVNGENFRTLAVLYSEDPTAASRGGELSFMSKGELDPAYAKAAWALKNKGDVSRIVESQFGYHIIQLVDTRGDQVSTRHIIMTPKPNPEAIASATKKLDSIARVIRKDSLNWNTAVLRFSQDENTRFNGGLMINPNDRGPYFEMNQLPRADYSVIQNNNMKVGEISAPFASVDDKQKLVYKIIKLQTLTEPHRANMKDDYNFLQEIARQNKIMSTMYQWIEDKIETSYIYINESYKRCNLRNSWVKE